MVAGGSGLGSGWAALLTEAEFCGAGAKIVLDTAMVRIPSPTPIPRPSTVTPPPPTRAAISKYFLGNNSNGIYNINCSANNGALVGL